MRSFLSKPSSHFLYILLYRAAVNSTIVNQTVFWSNILPSSLSFPFLTENTPTYGCWCGSNATRQGHALNFFDQSCKDFHNCLKCTQLHNCPIVDLGDSSSNDHCSKNAQLCAEKLIEDLEREYNFNNQKIEEKHRECGRVKRHGVVAPIQFISSSEAAAAPVATPASGVTSQVSTQSYSTDVDRGEYAFDFSEYFTEDEYQEWLDTRYVLTCDLKINL